MSNWTIDSRDQYTADMDTRYSEYSDIDNARYRASMVNYRPVHGYEDMYLSDTQGRPSYYPCRCDACPLKNVMAPGPRPPMRKKTVEERQRDMPSLAKRCGKGTAENMWGDFTGLMGGTEGSAGVDGEGYSMTTMFIIFLLVVIVCLCYSYSMAVGRIDAQMKMLAQLLKK